ncbi:MAG: yecD [Gammaproteobacteria bacterium]|jgi:nicotinamidase-related amidase|nr:yecD [Gammaproteobacteria bacterium]
MNTLLLCIDFINDIVHPEGKIAASAQYITEHQVIEHANEAIAAARKKHIPIVQVKVGFSKDYRECPKHSSLFGKALELGALQLNSWGCEFHERLNVEPEDTIIIKHRVSALYATPLEAILRANNITQIVLCGVSTNMAIETAVRELHDRDYEVIILTDACGAASSEIHQASLASLSRIARILPVQAWFQTL